jgi:predicted nucleic acid-binding protein
MALRVSETDWPSTSFVLDASVALSWCFDDERDPGTQALLERLEHDSAVVPGIWPLEVGNALIVAERRGRATAEQTGAVIDLLSQLPIHVEQRGGMANWATLLTLARMTSLSTYDAAYLDLALRTGWPLASCDNRLRQAAEAAGVALLP